MSTEPLTIKQLADIIFQRDERITRGILDDRSTRERLRDKFLVHTERSTIRNANPNPWERLRNAACISFEGVAKVAEEHPRSLKKAAYELKALGFSNEQIRAIKKMVHGFALEPKADLDHILKKEHPNTSRLQCDDAFLGVALLEDVLKRLTPKTREELEQYVDEYDKARVDAQANRNTMFSPANEALAYKYFMEFAERYVPAVLGADALIPNNANKRYEAALSAPKPGA